MRDTAYVLTAPDTDPWLQLDEAGHDGVTYEKEVIYDGQFEKGDQHFGVDAELRRHWEQTHNELADAGYEVPVPLEHTRDPDKKRARVLGYVSKTDSKGREALFARVRFNDVETAKGVVSRGNDVSLFSPPQFKTVLGKVLQRPIRHLALTDYPVIPGLDGWQPIALSWTSDLELANPEGCNQYKACGAGGSDKAAEKTVANIRGLAGDQGKALEVMDEKGPDGKPTEKAVSAMADWADKDLKAIADQPVDKQAGAIKDYAKKRDINPDLAAGAVHELTTRALLDKTDELASAMDVITDLHGIPTDDQWDMAEAGLNALDKERELHAAAKAPADKAKHQAKITAFEDVFQGSGGKDAEEALRDSVAGRKQALEEDEREGFDQDELSHGEEDMALRELLAKRYGLSLSDKMGDADVLDLLETKRKEKRIPPKKMVDLLRDNRKMQLSHLDKVGAITPACRAKLEAIFTKDDALVLSLSEEEDGCKCDCFDEVVGALKTNKADRPRGEKSGVQLSDDQALLGNGRKDEDKPANPVLDAIEKKKAKAKK